MFNNALIMRRCSEYWPWMMKFKRVFNCVGRKRQENKSVRETEDFHYHLSYLPPITHTALIFWISPVWQLLQCTRLMGNYIYQWSKIWASEMTTCVESKRQLLFSRFFFWSGPWVTSNCIRIHIGGLSCVKFISRALYCPWARYKQSKGLRGLPYSP